MKRIELILIGGSAGSLDILLKILSGLDDTLGAAVVVVLHRKSSNDSVLVDVLSAKCKLQVKEADEKEEIRNNVVYVAPSDYHLLVEADHTFSLDVSEKINFSRPSIDVTFESASEVYKSSLVAVLLSGANADGVAGLIAVKSSGGAVVVQDPATAEVPYMPQQAVNNVSVDILLTPAEAITLMERLKGIQII